MCEAAKEIHQILGAAFHRETLSSLVDILHLHIRLVSWESQVYGKKGTLLCHAVNTAKQFIFSKVL
jgi:hypothetical protein